MAKLLDGNSWGVRLWHKLGKYEGTSFAFDLHALRFFDEVELVVDLNLIQRKKGDNLLQKLSLVPHESMSMYILKDPSFFLTNNIRAPQGEELGLTNPFEYTTYYAGDGQLSFSQHITCLRVSSYPAPTYQSYQQLGLLATIDAYPLLLLLWVIKVSSPNEFLVSTVDETVSLKGLILAEVRLSSTRFHVLAIITSIDLTSGPSEVSSGVGFGLLAKGVGFLYAKAEENPLGYDAYECGYT
ncbi:hypothetical protein Tco_0597496 [Tanacetum coccineum]